MTDRADISDIIRELCALVSPLFPQEEPEAILFGSYARGDAEPDSDLDVLLLVDMPRDAISERSWQVGSLAAELLLEHGIVVSPIVENRRYFRENAEVLPFFRNIQREGVPFCG